MPRSKLRHYQRLLAPGTGLRSGLDRVLRGGTGALVMLGNNPAVRRISSGGFNLDVEFSPQALRELAKMDGAIVLSNDLQRIVAAGVHLVPPGDLPSAETGTRHRSADRASQHCQVAAVTVSASMSTISLFVEGNRHVLESTSLMLGRADQTLATLARFAGRLGDLLAQFSGLEVSEQVTLRDLVVLAQRYETTRRLSQETQYHVDQLGVEGRLISLQHAELMAPFDELAELLAADYAHHLPDPDEFSLAALSNFSAEELMSTSLVAERIGFGSGVYLESPLKPRGARLLSSVGRLPQGLIDKLLEAFSLGELLACSTVGLTELDGIGTGRARLIRDAIIRITELGYRHSESI